MPKQNKALPVDENGNKFFSASIIRAPLAVNITAAGFTAVTLTAALPCKGVHVSTRDAADWLLSNVSAGTTYATMKSGMYIDIAANGGEILFYAKGTSTTVLEVVPFD